MADNTPIVDKDGKMTVMGVNCDLGSILGEKIVDNVMASITEEEMTDIVNNIKEMLINTTASTAGPWRVKSVIGVDGWNRPITREYTLVDLAKVKFGEKVTADLNEKISQIVSSKEYHDQIDKLAEEIVEFAENGYKQEMKLRIMRDFIPDPLNSDEFRTTHAKAEGMIHILIDGMYNEITKRLGGY